jgi:hypothetical protein
VAQGDSAIKSQLATDVANCPDEQFVLVGYSQGAQVVGDALGGGGGGNLGTRPPRRAVLDRGQDPGRDQMRRLVADRVVLDVGNDPGATGLFPRPGSETLAPFAAKIQSYCDTGDPFCTRGANLSAHLDYTQKYNSAASTFVTQRLNAAGIH